MCRDGYELIMMLQGQDFRSLKSHRASPTECAVTCPLSREENEAKLRELRRALEEERRAEREQLEAQKRRELQRLRDESELELMEEKRQLHKRAEEVRASLKLEVSVGGCDVVGCMVCR